MPRATRCTFSHEVVENRFGFDDLRKGQQLEYTLENAPYLRAASVRVAAGRASNRITPGGITSELRKGLFMHTANLGDRVRIQYVRVPELGATTNKARAAKDV